MADNSEWEQHGGYVRADSRGRPTYYIRRQVHGTRYDLSTRKHSLRAALAELEKFDRDPSAYVRARTTQAGRPVVLDKQLAKEFLEWSRDVKRNSPGWVRKQQDYVAWWSDQFKGLDLRRVNLVDHIKPALAKANGARGHRIAVLKAVYSWLRKEKHRLTVADDPTFQTLTVPQARPEQWRRVKAVPRESVQKARKKLDQHWRDALDVQAGTGWHTTEVQRFARSGSTEPYPGTKAKGIGGVLVLPQTKAGDMLKTAVSPDVLAAAKRLLKHGALSIEKYGLALKAACTAAKVPAFTPGQLRHSVATWAINQGADPATVAAFLNHKSPRTTRRFYATHAVPAKVPTLL